MINLRQLREFRGGRGECEPVGGTGGFWQMFPALKRDARKKSSLLLLDVALWGVVAAVLWP